MTIHSTAILGRGALGLMYGDFLQRALPENGFYFIAEADRAERYKRETLTVNGRAVRFKTKTPKEITTPPDLLIVALKGPHLTEGLQTVKGLVGPRTILLSVMNGITSESVIEQELGCSRVVHSVSQRMDALFQNHSLTYRSFGELVLGLSPEHQQQKEVLAELEAFFDQIGMPYVHDDRILHRMWCKWMLNVGVNQTLAVFDDVFARVHRPGKAREVLIGAMREVLKVSEAEGTGLTEKDFQEYLQIIDELNPQGMPSMRQDRLAGRKTEVDLFAGTVIAKARRYSIPVPVNEFLLREIRQFEAAYPNFRNKADEPQRK